MESTVNYSAVSGASLNPALWAPPLKPSKQPVFRLFCFPYAGGGLPAFRAWTAAFPSDLELRVIQLPGRGYRFREKRFHDLDHAADVLASQLEPVLDQPFAFFGHSLGALLAFETARRLRLKGLVPSHLFFSGNNAPHFPRRLPAIHQLPDSSFLEELKALNGIQPAVLESAELLDLFLPVIRSDFTMLETYVCDPAQQPFECPVTVFGGLQDPRTTRDGLEAWRHQTTAKFELSILEGDHFFLESARPLLLQRVVYELEGYYFKQVTGQA